MLYHNVLNKDTQRVLQKLTTHLIVITPSLDQPKETFLLLPLHFQKHFMHLINQHYMPIFNSRQTSPTVDSHT
jgi:hypothetical protein